MLQKGKGMEKEANTEVQQRIFETEARVEAL
jgi:hypothetical protein